MRTLLTIVLTLMLVFFATTALADRGYGHRYDNYYAQQGERIDRHLDRQGNRIEHRFEQKAHRAEVKGNYRQAEKFRSKGKQINHHLDRKGDRIHARIEQHRHHATCGHRAAYVKPRIAYRGHNYGGNYFNLMIRQPGLWFGGTWHD